MMFLAWVVIGCGGGGGDWPAAELVELRAECEIVTDAATAARERATCHCLYDRLPGRVAWDDFRAWRESPGHEGAVRDPEMTKHVAEVSAECALETLGAK